MRNKQRHVIDLIGFFFCLLFLGALEVRALFRLAQGQFRPPQACHMPATYYCAWSKAHPYNHIAPSKLASMTPPDPLRSIDPSGPIDHKKKVISIAHCTFRRPEALYHEFTKSHKPQ